MRVLFITRDSIAYERIGVIVLSAALKASGNQVHLLVASRFRREELREAVGDFSPHLIAYTAMTGEHLALLDINRDLKNHFDFHAVFGGAHATFYPRLVEEPGVDAVCVGEGDESFPEFCRRLENGEDYWKTPNFHVKHQGAVVSNPVQPLVAALDDLPFPDRAIIYQADPEIARVGTKHFMTARGCPYHCTYCFNDQYNETYRGKGKVLRMLSPEKVIAEIQWVRANYPLDHIYFIDDLFLLKPRWWLHEFCDCYKSQIGIPFSCTVRANVVKDEMIARLHDAGLAFAWMGVECGDERIANDVLKRQLTNDHLINAARVLKRQGVRLITQNLIGLPVDDAYQTDLRTLDLNIAIRPDFGWSSILYPYPGTAIEAYCRESGHLEGEPGFLETNKRSSVLEFSSPLEKRRIENLHKLFGIIVRFPALRPLVDFLCVLPLSSFYRVIFYLWYGYSLKFNLSTIKSIRKEIPIFARLFFRILAKS